MFRASNDRPPPGTSQARRAFTLIELLVTISIISLLAALTLPAIMQARQAAARTICQNNLRNLSVAMLAAADSAQRLPASGHFGRDAASGGFTNNHSWVVTLLPWLERQDLYGRWNLDLPIDASPNAELAKTHVKVLVCPSDLSASGQGDLSYVVNGGFGWTQVYNQANAFSGIADCPMSFGKEPLDLNGNGVVCPNDPSQDGTPGDKLLFKQTALFFPENWKVPGGTERFHRLAEISDGLSQTLMFSENVRAGYDPYQENTNWACPHPQRNCFFVSFAVCAQGICKAGNVDYARANRRPESINGGLEAAEGEAPWPSSFHTGGVHAAFADGHVRFISEGIAGPVHAALVSPQGTRIKGPLAQITLSDTDY
jgi:prepilin-type N-terminal cleavage/methylation domain-containing protein/prepilin-type processing-associated H-X9-DG protein